MHCRFSVVLAACLVPFVPGCFGGYEGETRPGKNPYSVSGRVTLLGAPVEDVLVTFTGPGAPEAVPTDADGRFVQDGFPVGSFTVELSNDDVNDFYHNGASGAVAVTVDQNISGLDFVAVPHNSGIDLLSPNGGGNAFLIDAPLTITWRARGEPGTHVRLQYRPSEFAAWVDIDTLALVPPPPDADTWWEYSTQWTPAAAMDVAEIRIESTTYSVLHDRSDGTFVVTASCSIAGMITASGAPLADTLVQFFVGPTLHHSTRTATEGSYLLAGIAAGTYTIVPADPAFTFTPGPKGDTVTVSPGDHATGHDFTAEPSNASITITSPVDDQPFYPGAAFELRFATTGLQGHDVRVEYDDGSGYATIDPAFEIADDGPQVFSHTLLKASSVANLTGMKVLITSVAFAGVKAEHVDGFRTYDLTTISGTVTKAGGGALANVTMTFTGPNAPADLITTDVAGAYSCGGFQPGTFTVYPTLTGYAFDPASDQVEVPEGEAQSAHFVGTPVGAAIQVISPNGGQVYVVGETPDVLVSTSSLAGYEVRIQYAADGATWVDVGTGGLTPGTASEVLTFAGADARTFLAGDVTAGAAGAFRAHVPSLATVAADASDNGFTVTPARSVTGTVYVGTSTTDYVENVELAFSPAGRDAGPTLSDAAGAYARGGFDATQDVTVTPVLASWVFERVSAGNAGVIADAPVDLSGGDAEVHFRATAAGASLTITSPADGDKLYPGSKFTLRFATTQLQGRHVKIEYDSGGGFVEIDPAYLITSDGAQAYTTELDAPAGEGVLDSKVQLTAVEFPSVTTVHADGFDTYVLGEIQGSVTAGGAPLAGVTVLIAGPNAPGAGTSQADGSFTFAGIQPGEFTVTPQLAGYAFDPTEITRAVAEDETSTGWTFTATSTSRSIVLNTPIDGSSIMPNNDTPVQFYCDSIDADATPKVKIEYSTDGGTNWTELEAAWPAAGAVADGYNTYVWAAGDKPETDPGQLTGVKLKVSSVSTPVVSGESIAGFTILRIAHLTGAITAGETLPAKPLNDVTLSFLGANPPPPVILTGTNAYDVSSSLAFVDGTYLVTAELAGWSFDPVVPASVLFENGEDETLSFSATPTTASITIDSPDGGTWYPNTPTDILFTTVDLAQVGDTYVELTWYDGSDWHTIDTVTISAGDDGAHTYTGWTTPNPVASPQGGVYIRATSVDWPTYTDDGEAFTVTNLPQDPTSFLAQPAIIGDDAADWYITLSWDDNAFNETGYEIERSTDGTNFSLLTTTAANATGYDDHAVSVGQEYWYTIRATAVATNSGWISTDAAHLELFTYMAECGLFSTGGEQQKTTWGDYDGDGDLDAAVCVGYGNDGQVSLYRNDGSFTFVDVTPATWPAIGRSYGAWGDYDSDGDLDYAVCGWAGDYHTGLFRNDGAGQFTEVAVAWPDAQWGSIAWGDYDNDCDLDIAIAGYDYDSEGVFVYRNDGGCFTRLEGNTWHGGGDQTQVAWADYNSDGYLDLSVVGESVARLYRNESNGRFAEVAGTGWVAEAGIVSAGISWGDFDSDGDLDVAISCLKSSAGYVHVYANNGTDTFSEVAVGSLEGVYGDPGSIAWGDYDGDGDLDLVYAGYEGTRKCFLYRNDGSSAFSQVSGANLPGAHRASVTWADCDNDSDLDILVTGYRDYDQPRGCMLHRNNLLHPNTVPTIAGSPTATFHEGMVRLAWPQGTDAQTPAAGLSYNVRIGSTPGAADILHPMSLLSSGRRMVVGIGNASSALHRNFVLPEAGPYYAAVQAIDSAWAGGPWSVEHGPFYAPPNAPTDLVAETISPTGIQLMWTDNSAIEDGYKVYRAESEAGPYDVVHQTLPPDTTSWTDDENSPGGAVVEGTHYWYRIVAFTNTEGSSLPATGDAVAAAFVEVVDVGFLAVEQCALGWADSDCDGDLDLAIAGTASDSDYNGILYRNDGMSSFAEEPAAGLPDMRTCSLDWGDYDNDGHVDLVLAGQVDSPGYLCRIYRNAGGNEFSATGTALPDLANPAVAWGDYDNDGDLDVIVCGDTGGTQITALFRNDGAGGFTELPAVSLVGVRTGAVCWGDYDNDGDADVAIAGYVSGSVVSCLYRNDGGGLFSEVPSAAFTGVNNCSLDWGDYDNDGDLDLLLAGRAGTNSYITKVYENSGGDIFTEVSGAGLTGVQQGSAAWGDYDNDGDLDIALAGETVSGDVAQLFRNDGGGAFSQVAAASLAPLHLGCLAWADADGDGDLDIILAGQASGGYAAKLYRNVAGGPLANAPSEPSGLATSVAGNTTIFTWSPATDIETPSDGLNYNLHVWRDSPAATICAPMADTSGGPTDGWRRVVRLGNAGHKTDDGGGKRTWWLNIREAGTYYWSVQAIDTSFAGGPWATAGTFVIAYDVPVLGVSVPGLLGHERLDLSWTDAGTDETGYEIERSPDGTAGSWAVVHTAAADVLSWQDTGLTPETTYYYRVRASVPGPYYTMYSNIDSATTEVAPTPPADPTGLAVSNATAGQLDLTWTDNAFDETSQRVERSPDGSTNWTSIATPGVNAESYTDTGVVATETWYYRVYAVKDGVDSVNSTNTASGTVQ